MNRAFVVSTSTGLNFGTNLGHNVTGSGNSRPCSSCWPPVATDHMFPEFLDVIKALYPLDIPSLDPR